MPSWLSRLSGKHAPGSSLDPGGQRVQKEGFGEVANQQVKDFWLTEFEKYSAWFRSEALAPIQNKVGQFLATPLMRNMVGQTESSIDFRKIMDEGKILIVNLSKGTDRRGQLRPPGSHDRHKNTACGNEPGRYP